MSNGNLSDVLTPGIVAACATAEEHAATDYLAAASLITAYARRHDGADDIASVARVLLADVIATTGRTGSDAAATAVARAAAWHGQHMARTVGDPVGDTLTDDVPVTAHDALNHADYPAPDRCARWGDRDTLGEAWDTLYAVDPDAADVIADLVTVADVWSDRAAQGGKSPVSIAALAAHRYGADRVTGRNRAALGTVVCDALVQYGEHARAVLNRHGIGAYSPGAPGSDVAHHERAPKRDTSTPASGPASHVVVTRSDGATWLALPDVWHRIHDANVADVLARPYDVPALATVGAARECVSADVAASTGTGKPSRRPAGVGVGIVYGAGHTAGAGTPEPRPVASRKRKRDGGVGSPTIPA